MFSPCRCPDPGLLSLIARLNVFRFVAGRTEATYLVSVNLPSAGRLATGRDALGLEPALFEWAADVARVHTVVRSGTWRELTR